MIVSRSFVEAYLKTPVVSTNCVVQALMVFHGPDVPIVERLHDPKTIGKDINHPNHPIIS